MTLKHHGLAFAFLLKCFSLSSVQFLSFILQNVLGTEESYLRQLEIEEMYGVKKDDDKKSKEK